MSRHSDPFRSATVRHSKTLHPQLAELDLIGISGPARRSTSASQVNSESSSLRDANPPPGASFKSGVGLYTDAQVLYYTLVQDGAIPGRFLAEFESLVEEDASRQARQTHKDEVQSVLWLHKRSKDTERTAKEEKQTVDLMAQMATLRPWRF